MTVPRSRARSNARRPPLRLVSALAIVFAASGVAAKAPLSVGGRVLDSLGKPLEGAEVTLVEFREPLTSQLDADSASTSGSDAEGRFLIHAPNAGVWRVVVQAPRHTPALLDLLPLTDSIELPPLRLEPSTDAQVQVVDPRGLPVANATLLAIPKVLDTPHGAAAEGIWPRPRWRAAHQVVRTNSEGLALLDVDMTRSRLVVLAEGFPPQRFGPGRRVSGSASPRSPIRVQIQGGRQHVLVAVDSAGRPVTGVLVLVDGLAVGETDPQGQLSFVARDHRSVRLVSEDGWAVGRLAESPTPTRLTLRPALSCRGEVVDRATGRAVGGSVVWSVDHPSQAVIADPSGRFALSLPFSPAGRIGAAGARHLPSRIDLDNLCSHPGVAELSVDRQLMGRVVDEADRPIIGSEIHLAPRDVPSPWQDLGTQDLSAWGRSDETGRFRIGGLAPGEPFWLRATAPGFVPARIDVDSGLIGSGQIGSGPAKAEQVVRLRRGRRLAGRVVDDSNDELLDGVRVTGVPSSASASAESMLTAADMTTEATSGPDGLFELPPLPPGDVDLRAVAEGYVPRRVRGIRLPAGEGVAELGPIRLTPEQVLRGRVVDPNDRALARCSVRRVGSAPAAAGTAGDADESSASCRRDGTFEISGLLADRAIRLRVESDGYRPALVDVTPSGADEPVRVELELAAQIAGRVVDSDGGPIANALVAASTDNRHRAFLASGNTAPTDDQGRFEFAGIGGGEFEILAFAEGYLEAATTVSIGPGERVDDLSLTLEQGAMIDGTVLDPEGLPVAGATLRILDDAQSSPLAGLPRLVAHSDAEGVFQLTGLRTGRRTLLADHTAFRAQRREIEIEPGEQELVVHLEPGLEISGTVVDSDGLAVSDAAVSLESLSGDGGMQRTRTFGDGTFRFRGLETGRFRAVASAESRSSDPARGLVDLRDQQITDLNLALRPGAVLGGRILGVSDQDLEQLQIWAQTAGLPQKPGRVLDDNGYRVSGLAEGDWIVRARLPDGQELRGRVRIVPGQSEATLDLEAHEGLTLSGVTTRGGVPVPGAVVVCTGDGGGGGTISDTNGRFSLGRLPPGRYLVTVLDPSGGEIRQPLDLSSDLQLTLAFDDASAGGVSRNPTSGDRR